MFWLVRKLFFLGILALLVWVILNLEYQGRPVKKHVSELVKTPLVQEITRQVRGAVASYLKKDVKESGPAMEELGETERRELEKLLKEEAEGK